MQLIPLPTKEQPNTTDFTAKHKERWGKYLQFSHNHCSEIQIFVTNYGTPGSVDGPQRFYTAAARTDQQTISANQYDTD